MNIPRLLIINFVSLFISSCATICQEESYYSPSGLGLVRPIITGGPPSVLSFGPKNNDVWLSISTWRWPKSSEVVINIPKSMRGVVSSSTDIVLYRTCGEKTFKSASLLKDYSVWSASLDGSESCYEVQLPTLNSNNSEVALGLVQFRIAHGRYCSCCNV